MKKIISLLFIIMFVFSNIAYANDLKIVVHNTGNDKEPYITLDGKKIDFGDAKPFLGESGTALVPARIMTELLGGEIVWNNNEQSINIYYEEDIIAFFVSSNMMHINGEDYLMDSKTMNINGYVYVPLNFLCQAYGNTVWYTPNEGDIAHGLFEIKSVPTSLTIKDIANKMYEKGVILEDERDGWYTNLVNNENVFRGNIPAYIKKAMLNKETVSTNMIGLTEAEVVSQQWTTLQGEQTLDLSDNGIKFNIPKSNKDIYRYETLPITNHGNSFIVDYYPSKKIKNSFEEVAVIYIMAYDRETKKSPFIVGHFWARCGERTTVKVDGLRDDRDYLLMIDNNDMLSKNEAVISVSSY